MDGPEEQNQQDWVEGRGTPSAACTHGREAPTGADSGAVGALSAPVGAAGMMYPSRKGQRWQVYNCHRLCSSEEGSQADDTNLRGHVSGPQNPKS